MAPAIQPRSACNDSGARAAVEDLLDYDEKACTKFSAHLTPSRNFEVESAISQMGTRNRLVSSPAAVFAVLPGLWIVLAA